MSDVYFLNQNKKQQMQKKIETIVCDGVRYTGQEEVSKYSCLIMYNKH